jgi:hypothetical protein
MTQPDAYRMIRRRARAAGIESALAITAFEPRGSPIT